MLVYKPKQDNVLNAIRDTQETISSNEKERGKLVATAAIRAVIVGIDRGKRCGHEKQAAWARFGKPTHPGHRRPSEED